MSDSPASTSSSLKHDLRTPLNHIIGYGEMLIEELEDGDDTSGLAPDLRKIHSAGRRLLGVVHELFDESIPESDRLNETRLHQEVRTPINQIIGYVELLQEEAESIEEAFMEDLGKIHAAAHRLLDLVLTHFGDGRFPVSAAERVEQRAPTTFTTRTESESSGTQQARRQGAPSVGRLLVADDDPDNREMLARRLQRLGHEVETVANGKDVIERVRSGGIDLLLLDIVMPEMDGYAVLDHLRINPPPDFLPIIVLSASDDSSRVAKCIEMGAEDYLPKPFDPLLLQARIESSLEKKRFRDREATYLKTIKKEKQRADDLLAVILPSAVAAELKMRGHVKPRRMESVSVLFTDIVGFTTYCEHRDPETVHRDLQELVETMEDVATAHGMEKIKTIGDAFLGACGLLTFTDNPTRDAVQCGLAMIEGAEQLLTPWKIRVGVNTGPVVAGVVGRQKYQYDIWGDTVNTAARMESQATPGTVCVSDATYELVKSDFKGKSLGTPEIKGKGTIELFEITGMSNAEPH